MGHTREFSWVYRGGVVLALVAFLGAILVSGESARAQSVFCPASVPSAPPPVTSVPNVRQISGNCTNPTIAGAASGSALASQAIGDLAGSATNQGTSLARKAIEDRRETSPEACPSGEILVDGICRALPAPAASIAPAMALPGVNAAPMAEVSPAPIPTARGVAKHRKIKVARRAPLVAVPSSVPTTKSPQPAIYDQSFRIGSWAQGFGGYDHRTGDENSVINCCTAQPSNTNITPLVLDASSTTSSGGFVGGIDATKRGLLSAQDAVNFGLLGSYTWTNISVRTLVTSTIPNQTASGSGLSSAHIDGPGVGFYATYFNQALSNSVLIKDDFLSLNENQSQILGFGACSCLGSTPFPVAQSGSGSANLNQLTISDDLSYRMHWYSWLWMEPTAGASFVNSSYSPSAAALGITDGHTVRLQAGARTGIDSLLAAYHVTTVLTGLVFDNVIVHGYNIEGQGFGQSGNILIDQGKLQGEVIASINVDLGRGLSASVQGYVYGARDIVGAGGQATLRVQW
jgi:hypothetical protein